MREGDERVVRALWEAMEGRRWDDAAALLHEDVVVEWPQSRERIRGRAHVVALNRDYPGDWHLVVEEAFAGADGRVVARVRILLDGKHEWALGVYEVEGGRVRRAVEHWASEYEAPAWRAAWVERMEPPKAP